MKIGATWQWRVPLSYTPQIASQTGGLGFSCCALGVEPHLGVAEFLLRLIAVRVGLQPGKALGEGRAVSSLEIEPVLAAHSRRQRRLGQGFEVINDVVQGVALFEVDDLAVGTHIGLDLRLEKTPRRMEQVFVVQRRGHHGHQFDAMALPVVVPYCCLRA